MLHSQALFGIMFGVAAFLVFLFYWKRFSGIRSTTRLYLKKQSTRNEKSLKTNSTSDDFGKPFNNAYGSKYDAQQDSQFNNPQFSTLSQEAFESSNQGLRTKNLNVMFMFNGHSFEAHEILGIPPGAGLKMIQEAYEKALVSVDPESREFLDAAFLALKENLKR